MVTIKVLSLDFDGTLVYPTVKTEDIYFKVFKEFLTHSDIEYKFRLFESEYLLKNPDLKTRFRSLGKLNTEQRKKLYFEWNEERIRFMFPSFQNNEILKYLDKVMTIMKQDQSLKCFPEIKETLKYFKDTGFSLYILSGNNKEYIEDFLDQHEIRDIFKDIYTPDYLKVDKKDIFPFYREQGYSFEEILHVGDDPELDYFAPKSLGMNALWLKRENNRYNDSTIPPNDIINTLTDLRNKLVINV